MPLPDTVDTLNMGSDNGDLFPQTGAQFVATGKTREGLVGQAECTVFAMRKLVDFAVHCFAEALKR